MEEHDKYKPSDQPEENKRKEEKKEEAAPTPEDTSNKEESTTPSAAELSSQPGASTPEKPASTEKLPYEESNEELIWLAQKVNDIRNKLGDYIVGQEEMVELLMTGIFSAGHVLLEGVPGVAKTLSAKVLSKALDVDFSRIQFTPDLMPSDVIGTSVFNMKESTFSFKKGPIFSNIVLIDEINRAPAKTQAALFEVMEERQITYDGENYQMAFPFLVIATQNPIEQEGTYSLPEAQLDRFLFKINLHYPSYDNEVQILHRYKNNIQTPSLEDIKPILTSADISKVQQMVKDVVIEDALVEYVAKLVDKTRNHGKIYLGASPRASLAILKSAKAIAAIRGRAFVTPDDIQFVANHVLNHRLILTPDAEMEGTTTTDIIDQILEEIEVPR